MMNADVFYNVQKLPLEIKINILKDFFSVKKDWKITKLLSTDIKKKEEIPFVDILKNFKDEYLFAVVNTINYPNQVGEIRTTIKDDNSSYFLYVTISYVDFIGLIDKYNLELF